MQKDYYKVLGLSSAATEEDIKKTYRKLARQYHPDLNPGDKAAEERFKEIGEAYEVLSDPGRRAKYDNKEQTAQSAGTASGSAARKPASPFTEEMYNAMRRQSRDYFDVEAQVKAKKEKSTKRNPLDAGDLFAAYFGQVGKEKKKK